VSLMHLWYDGPDGTPVKKRPGLQALGLAVGCLSRL
jgi:hypothetical protein